MRKLHILIVFCFLFLLSHAQTKVTHKLGLALYTKLQDPKFKNSPALKPILVKGDADIIQSLTAKYHGLYKFSAGDISSIAIPYKNLMSFSQEKAVVRIEATTAKGRSFMDTARIVNNIDSVQAGIAPLSQAYKGTGVIVGIIDGGFYFRHRDFRRANGNTRILYLWDQYIGGAGHRCHMDMGSPGILPRSMQVSAHMSSPQETLAMVQMWLVSLSAMAAA